MEKTIELKGVDLGVFFGPADTNLKIVEENLEESCKLDNFKSSGLEKKAE